MTLFVRNFWDLVLSFPPSSVMILFDFSFLFSFFFIKDQIASIQLKQVFVFLKYSVCVF